MNRPSLPWVTVVAGATLALFASRAEACPFCSAMSETLAEQIANMDAAVVARLSEVPAPAAGTAAADAVPTRCKFQVVESLKGEPLLNGGSVIETVYFGDAQKSKGETFLLLGVSSPTLMWSSPMPLPPRVRDYVRQLSSLPPEGVERLAFFQKHLEDPEEVLARDAYEEFARASYDVVKSLRDQMNHPQLVAWIQDTNVPVSRRRLYLTMLGVCGSQADLPWLEKLLRSEDRSVRSGLDAMIACYLTLAGPEGLPLVEELFLKDADAEYADTYAAIMALRFHGSEGDRVPRERLVLALRNVLERPQLADLVIPDLARWEDWSVMPRLVKLFKEADESTSWVRVPVVNYLRACPEPAAKDYLVELEQIDPEAVKRATSFFPFGGGGPAARPQKN